MKSLLRILDSTGDTRIPFDMESGEGLVDAQRAIADLQKRGGSLFRIQPGSDKSSQRITSLPEKLEVGEEIIGVPPITAG